MDVFTMVTIIVVAASAGSVARSYFKNRAEHRPDADEGVQQAVEDLRRRVEVLERIVTDDKRRLAAEINDLDAGERPI